MSQMIYRRAMKVLSHMSCRPSIMQELDFIACKSGVNSAKYYVLSF